MAYQRTAVKDEDLRKIADEKGPIAAMQYLLRHEHGVMGFSDSSAKDQLSFSFRHDPENNMQRGYASIEVNAFKDHAALEVGGRLFNNKRVVGMADNEWVYSNGLDTSGMRYAADILARTYKESSSASDFNLKWQQASGGLPQGYNAHVGDLRPKGKVSAHGNETLAESVLNIYQLVKPSSMTSDDYLAAVNQESTRKNVIPGVHFGVSETENTFESISNMMPLNGLSHLDSLKWKSVKSSQFRNGMPMANTGMPGTGTFKDSGTDYTWGRMKVGQIQGSPGGGIVMAQEPYAIRHREEIIKLLPGELANAQFTTNDQNHFEGEDLELGTVTNGRKLLADLGGASSASIVPQRDESGKIINSGVIVKIGHGTEVMDTLKQIPGMEAYANDIRTGFAYQTIKPAETWATDKVANKSGLLKRQEESRAKVMAALAELPQFKNKVDFAYSSKPNISIHAFVDAYVPASIKGFGLKAGVSMLDPRLGDMGYMGMIEGSSIKNLAAVRNQDIQYYKNLYEEYTHASVDEVNRFALHATELEKKETEIALEYHKVWSKTSNVAPDWDQEAYKAVLPMIEKLGAIHRVTRSDEFLVPEERSNSGRLSGMDLLSLYRTGGPGAKSMVKGMIREGADPATGSILASLFNTGGKKSLKAPNLPLDMEHDKVLDQMKALGVKPDDAFEMDGRTFPSMNAIGTQGAVYASVRRMLSAGNESELSDMASAAMEVIDKTFTSGDAFAKRASEVQTYNLGGRLRYWDPSDKMFTGSGNTQNDVYVGRKEISRLSKQLDVPIEQVEHLANTGQLHSMVGGYPNKNAMAVGRIKLANSANGFQEGIYNELEFSIHSALHAVRFARDNDGDFGPQPVAITRTRDSKTGRWMASPIAGSSAAFEEQGDTALLALQSLAAMSGPKKVYEQQQKLKAVLGRDPTNLETLIGIPDRRVTNDSWDNMVSEKAAEMRGLLGREATNEEIEGGIATPQAEVVSGSVNRQKFVDSLTKAHTGSPELLDAMIAMSDARAKTWAGQNERSVDQWYEKNITEVRSDDPTAPGALHQSILGGIAAFFKEKTTGVPSTNAQLQADHDALFPANKSITEKERKEYQERIIAEFEAMKAAERLAKEKEELGPNANIFGKQGATIGSGNFLVATHSIKEADLLKVLNVGGLASPSIAVQSVNAQKGIAEGGYGPITFILGQDAIDPKIDSRNRTFVGDAWTPTVHPNDKGQVQVNGEWVEPTLDNLVAHLTQFEDPRNAIFQQGPVASNQIHAKKRELFSVEEMRANEHLLSEYPHWIKQTEEQKEQERQKQLGWSLDSFKDEYIKYGQPKETTKLSKEDVDKAANIIRDHAKEISENAGDSRVIDKYVKEAGLDNTLLLTDYIKRFSHYTNILAKKKMDDWVDDRHAGHVFYFEAKPQKAVYLSQVRAAVVPYGTSKEILDGLKKNKIPVSFWGTDDKGNTISQSEAAIRAAKSTGSLFQTDETGEIRGAVSFDKTGKSTMHLKGKQDATTFVHEMFHIFSVEGIQGADVGIVAKHLGTTAEQYNKLRSGYIAQTLDTGQMDEWRGHQERLAGWGEQYVFKGKAPHKELHGVFARFKSFIGDFLGGLSGKSKDLIPDEVTQVFGHLLGTTVKGTGARPQSAGESLRPITEFQIANGSSSEKSWYVKDHLDVVDNISQALARKTGGKVDYEMLHAMTWMHDLPKMMGDKTEQGFETHVRPILEQRYAPDRVEEIMTNLKSFEGMKGMTPEQRAALPIEVQIASAADAASHYVPGFLQDYQNDHPGITESALEKSNNDKLGRDKQKLSPQYEGLLDGVSMTYASGLTNIHGNADLVELNESGGKRIEGMAAGVHEGNENVLEKTQTQAESGLSTHDLLYGYEKEGKHVPGISDAEEIHDESREMKKILYPQLTKTAQDVNEARLQAPVYGMVKQLGLNLADADRDEFNKAARSANPYWEKTGLEPYATATQTFESIYQVPLDFQKLPENMKKAYSKLYYSNGFASKEGYADSREQLASTMFSAMVDFGPINQEAIAYMVGGQEHMAEVTKSLLNRKPGGVIDPKIFEYMKDSPLVTVAGINQAINFMQDDLEGKFDNMTQAQASSYDLVKQNHIKFVEDHPEEYEAIMAGRRGSVPKNMFGRDLEGDVIGEIFKAHLGAAASSGIPNRIPMVDARKKVEGTVSVQAKNTLLDKWRANRFLSASAMGALAGEGPYAKSQTLSTVMSMAMRGNKHVKLEMDRELSAKGAVLEQKVEAFDTNPETHPFGHMFQSYDDLKKYQQDHPDYEAPKTIGRYLERSATQFETTFMPDALQYDETKHTIMMTDFKASKKEHAMSNREAYAIQQSAYAHRMVYMAKNGTTATDAAGKVTHTGERQELYRSLVEQANFSPAKANSMIADLNDPSKGFPMISAQLYANDDPLDIDLTSPKHLDQHIIPIQLKTNDEMTKIANVARARVAIEIQNNEVPTAIGKAVSSIISGAKEVDLGDTKYHVVADSTVTDVAGAFGPALLATEEQLEANRQRDAQGKTPGNTPSLAPPGSVGGGARGGVTGGAPPTGTTIPAGGMSVPDDAAWVEIFKKVSTWMYQNNMAGTHGQSHGGTLDWGEDQAAWNSAIVNNFDAEGKFTGDEQTVLKLIKGGLLGNDQIKFIENARRLAAGKVSPSEANDMLTNTISTATMGPAMWASDGVAGSASTVAHERVMNSYVQMTAAGNLSTADYRAKQQVSFKAGIEQERANLLDLHTQLATPKVSHANLAQENDDSRVSIGNEMSAGNRIDPNVTKDISDPITRNLEDRAIDNHNASLDYAKQGLPSFAAMSTRIAADWHTQATQASADFLTKNTNLEQPREASPTDAARIKQHDVLIASMQKLADHFDKLSDGVDPAITTVKDFKDAIDKTKEVIKTGEEAKSIAQQAGLFEDGPDDKPGAGKKRRATVDLGISLAKASIAEGGEVLTAAKERLTEDEFEQVQEHATKKKAPNNVAGKLLSGMFAFQMARDLRYTFTPLEQAAAKFDEQQQQAVSMLGQNGMGYNQRLSGQGMWKTVGSNIGYGFGQTTSHTMAGLGALISGNASDNGASVGSGPLGAAASVALPALGSAAMVASLAQILAPEIVVPLAIGTGLVAGSISAISSLEGAKNDKVAMARARTTAKNVGIDAARNEDFWANLANVTTENPNIMSANGIMTTGGYVPIGPIAPYETPPPTVEQQAAADVFKYFQKGGTDKMSFGDLSTEQRRAFMAGAVTASGASKYTEIGDAARLDRPMQNQLMAYSVMRAGSKDNSWDIYQKSVDEVANAEDPMDRRKLADSIAQSMGQFDSYAGNDIAQSKTPFMDLVSKQNRINALGGASQAYQRVKAGFSMDYQSTLNEIDTMASNPLEYTTAENYVQAVGVFSQLNGGAWGAVAAERAGRGPAESIAAPLRAFAGTGPTDIAIAQRSMQESRLTEYAALERRYSQFGGTLGTKTGNESDARFEFDTQRAGIQADIVQSAISGGKTPEQALKIAQSVTPDRVSEAATGVMNVLRGVTIAPTKAYTPAETATQMGAKWSSALTPMQQGKASRLGLGNVDLAQMGQTTQGQMAFEYMTSLTPESTTVAMSMGINPMGLKPSVDLSTGGGLFERSMWGLNGTSTPSNEEVGQFFAGNSTYQSQYSTTKSNRWQNMSQTASGRTSQNKIIAAAQNGGMVDMQRLGQQWQYEISDRMEAASIGLSQQGARLSHEYATQWQQPEAAAQLAMSQAQQFGSAQKDADGKFMRDTKGKLIDPGVQTKWMSDNGIPAYQAGRGSFAIAKDQYALDLAGAQSQNLQSATRIGWQIADINKEQGRFGITSGWQREDMNINRGRQLTQRGWQMQEFGYQSNELSISRQSFREDTAYNKQVKQLQYGWQMEDADINIKRSTGFERRQLVKQKGRDTEMYNLETNQTDVQTKRQEDQFKREAAHMKLQESHFKTQSKWEDDDWKKQTTRFEIETKWKNDDFNTQRNRAELEKKWATEGADRAIKSLELRKEQMDAEQSYAVTTNAEKLVMQKAEIDNEQKRFELSMQAVVMTLDEKNKTRELQTQIEDMRIAEGDRVRALNKLQEEFYKGMIEWMRTQPWYHAVTTAGENVTPPPAGGFVPDGSGTSDRATPPPPGQIMDAMGGIVAPGKIFGESGPEMVLNGDGSSYALPTRFLTPKSAGSSSGSYKVEAMMPVTLEGKVIAEALIPFLITSIRKNEMRNVGRK